MDVFIVCWAVKLMLYNFHRNKLGANKQHKDLSWELINYRRVWFGQFIVEAKTTAKGHFFTPCVTTSRYKVRGKNESHQKVNMQFENMDASLIIQENSENRGWTVEIQPLLSEIQPPLSFGKKIKITLFRCFQQKAKPLSCQKGKGESGWGAKYLL